MSAIKSRGHWTTSVVVDDKPIWDQLESHSSDQLLEHVIIEGVERLLQDPVKHSNAVLVGIVHAATDRETASEVEEYLYHLAFRAAEISIALTIGAIRELAADPGLAGHAERWLHKAAEHAKLTTWEVPDDLYPTTW